MPDHDDSTSELHPAAEPAWVSVLTAPSAQGIADAALVLTSTGIDNRTHRLNGVWHVLVRGDDAAAARTELLAWSRENRVRGRPSAAPMPSGNGWWAVAIYLGLIWLLPWLESWPALHGLREEGILHAEAFRDGAWWLPVTALTLHADLAHIVANSLFGGLFGYLLGRWLGTGLGWLLTLLAAVAANATNASLQPDDFRSLGASTAVFAALGLTGAFGWRRGAFASDDRRRRFAPAFAAIAMIALTGTSGERVDIFAHLFGFAFGFLFGLTAARLPLERLGVSGQWICGVLALSLVGSAWWAATA